jgi:arylsulfatase A-like enzyme
LRKNRSRPFFLFVHLWEPHYDYIPPPPYDKMFVPRGYVPQISMHKFFYNEAIHAAMSQEDLDYVLAQYEGEIAYTDHLIDELLTALDDLGISEETVVIVTADHGEEFFEHGHKGHRRALYDESILVPLIVRGPGVVPRPNGIENVASHTDIAPTVLAILGLPRNAEMRGFDLGPLLGEGAVVSQGTRVRKVAVSELLYQRPPGGALCDQFAVRSLDWKAIRNCSDSLEVFRLAGDPDEHERLAPDGLAGVERIAEINDSLRTLVIARAESLPKEGVDDVVIDDALRARLNALGYLK